MPAKTTALMKGEKYFQVTDVAYTSIQRKIHKRSVCRYKLGFYIFSESEPEIRTVLTCVTSIVDSIVTDMYMAKSVSTKYRTLKCVAARNLISPSC
jgi:hypothetical protein